MDKSFDYLCSTLKNGTYTVSIKRKVEPKVIVEETKTEIKKSEDDDDDE